MSIFHILVWRNHPATAAGLCLLGCTLIAVIFIYEGRRRHNQRKKIKRVCKHCGSPDIDRKHVRVKLSPDLSGSFVKNLFSRADYLCQTQVTCLNPECGHLNEKGNHVPFPRYDEKTYPKHWGFKKLFRYRQIQIVESIGNLIEDKDGIVKGILKDREPMQKRVKKWETLPIKKPELKIDPPIYQPPT